jgi:hypothetical protein
MQDFAVMLEFPMCPYQYQPFVWHEHIQPPLLTPSYRCLRKSVASEWRHSMHFGIQYSSCWQYWSLGIA